MIESKALLAGIYCVFLLLSLTAPYLALVVDFARVRDNWINLLFLTLGSLICFIFLLRLEGKPILALPLVLSTAFLLPLIEQKNWTIAGGLLAIPFIAATTWWDPALTLGEVRMSAFVAIGLLAASLPRIFSDDRGVPAVPAFVIFLGLGIFANCATAPLSTPLGFGIFWHHWGVYVATSQNLLAGGVPFTDFPLQYGFGPALLMVAGCYFDCWTGAYIVIALANIALLLTMACCAILLLRQSQRGTALLALIALLAASLAWTSYPPNLLSVLATPSTGGLRFLPLSSLMLFIAIVESKKVQKEWPGHILWILGVLWSPESAIFVTLVWWPYLALRDLHDHPKARLGTLAKTVIMWAMKAVCALALTIAGIAVLFRLIFAEWPSVKGFLVYIQNPPGMLPVNLHGPVWILPMAVVIAIAGIARANSGPARITSVCLLGMVAVTTYYLGRSHDNNVLNLFPFVTLLLISTLNLNLPMAMAGFVRVMLVGIIAWPVTFGVTEWSTAWRAGKASSVGMGEILENLDVASPNSWPITDAAMSAFALTNPPTSDLANALNELALTGDELPVWVNNAMLLLRNNAAPAWTGVNNLANYGLLPSDVIVTFIKRGAERFKRSGWLVVDRAQPGPWLDHFKTAYQVSEQRVFGGYDAYRLVPK